MKLLDILKTARKQMEKDYKEGNEGKYPPLYSRDYLFGKIQAVKEIQPMVSHCEHNLLKLIDDYGHAMYNLGEESNDYNARQAGITKKKIMVYLEEKKC